MMQTIVLFEVDAPTGSNFYGEQPTLPEMLGRRVPGVIDAFACNRGNLVPHSNHPFLYAAHVAFSQHVPLVLSPDDIWLCIIEAFAMHVNVNAEALRDRFVSHKGRELISIRRDNFDTESPENDWNGVFAEFAERITAHVGDVANVLIADFSTTTAIEKGVSQIVLMSAMAPYFSYEMLTLCGIPRITLLGTPDDWQRIRARAALLAPYDLTRWVPALLRVLDEFVAAANGNADEDFWRSFYKRHQASGGPYVSGWINTFFPYIVRSSTFGRSSELQVNPFYNFWETVPDQFAPGPRDDAYPTGLSCAPFMWRYLGNNIPMEFRGGFVGVSRDRVTLAMQPVIGWVIRKRTSEA
jgi:hypothetical protein